MTPSLSKSEKQPNTTFLRSSLERFAHPKRNSALPLHSNLRSSIFGLIEHEDKQVHQIARNFRDRWIVRPLSKRSCIDRDDCRINTHSGLQYNRCLTSQNQW